MFMLRTTNPLYHMDLWDSYDKVTRESLNRILGAPLSDLQWKQAILPVSLGGLGLRAVSDHAPAAYVVSYLAALDLKEQKFWVLSLKGLKAVQTVNLFLQNWWLA